MTEDRAAYRKRRLAELMAEAEARRAKSRAAREGGDRNGPVVEVRRGAWAGDLVVLVVLLFVLFVLLTTAMTVERFSGHDFAEARRTGDATVVSCARRGPVTFKGFGYYDACTVSVNWGWNGTRLTIDQPGFFKGEKPGDTFTIGENQSSRGTIGFSRPVVPSRGWVTAVAMVIACVALIPFFLLVLLLREWGRRLFGRRG
ncbi:hypothetical protein BJY16_002145 [Actinoplanes octamycinicus]|uniref:Uncharacterized protein n=1 Tax=Actinoplanes octamycinicus TaxID=135948 RepID=A0A7W7GUU2_9ACTN|nr:DUF6346 domain-containing protein [Actinoplanes octamycinicus]MBB4738686.1 hypothetical protein [Actinoplanes octamycinicus]GIE61419.1 hypothetical protein Aoc01nite_68210 [Actinoplanes octamycinicus]